MNSGQGHRSKTSQGALQHRKPNQNPPLVVPTNMALEPEDGCCVICAALPSVDRNVSTRYEMQLLVDARSVTPPPPADRDVRS